MFGKLRSLVSWPEPSVAADSNLSQAIGHSSSPALQDSVRQGRSDLILTVHDGGHSPGEVGEERTVAWDQTRGWPRAPAALGICGLQPGPQS